MEADKLGVAIWDPVAWDPTIWTSKAYDLELPILELAMHSPVQCRQVCSPPGTTNWTGVQKSGGLQTDCGPTVWGPTIIVPTDVGSREALIAVGANNLAAKNCTGGLHSEAYNPSVHLVGTSGRARLTGCLQSKDQQSDLGTAIWGLTNLQSRAPRPWDLSEHSLDWETTISRLTDLGCQGALTCALNTLKTLVRTHCFEN